MAQVAQVDLSSILANVGGPHQAGPIPQLVQQQATAPKKVTQTAAQKRAQTMLHILQGQDRFGLEYCSLCLQLTLSDVTALAAAVKAAYNLQ